METIVQIIWGLLSAGARGFEWFQGSDRQASAPRRDPRPPRAPWRLERIDSDQCQLTNLGPRAVDVRVLAVDDPAAVSDAGPWPSIDAGASVGFRLSSRGPTAHPFVAVRWISGSTKVEWATYVP